MLRGAGWRAEARCELRVGDGLAREHLAVARRDARPVRRLPDVEPYDGSRPSRWCHGGILQSSGRSGALPATPTLPGRGARAWQFPISRSERRAPSVATPPRGLFGVGADGHPEAPDRRPLGACPYRRQCAECSPPKPIGGLPQTVMGRRFGAGLTGTYGSTCNKARAFGCGSAVLWKRMHASYLGHLRTMS